MPTRSRSHQLEDQSIIYFSGLLPAAWVVRRKEKDYGVDLEVEIFDDSGQATGLIFLVQIRGTDAQRRSEKLKLSVAQVEYFRTLDAQTLVVRYCSVKNEVYSQWSFNIMTNTIIKENQKEFTYSFLEEERWKKTTPDSIRKTLETLRLIQTYPRYLPVAFAIVYENTNNSSHKYLIDCIHSDLNRCPALASDTSPSILFSINIRNESITVRLDHLSSIKLKKNGIERKDAVTSILYCLSTLLMRHGLPSQAARVSKYILRNGTPHHSKYLALQACIALDLDLRASVELAILNGIHKDHDIHYAQYLHFLLIAAYDEADRDYVVMSFYAAALEKAHEKRSDTEASVYYSMGNYLGVRQKYTQAVHAYNRARRLRTYYLEADYFLKELAGCFFSAGRYKCAAEIYKRSISICSDQRDELHLGDALLFSGDLLAAKDHFDVASGSNEFALCCEANLKSRLCVWLMAFVGSTDIPTNFEEGKEFIQSCNLEDSGALRHVLTKLNALDEFVHFNIGTHNAREGLFENAINHFLFAAFKASGDLEAWSFAMLSALKSGESEMVVAILSVCLSLRGRDSYHQLREIIAKQIRLDSVLLEFFDELFRALPPDLGQVSNKRPIIRALAENSFDVAHKTGDE